MSILTVIVLLLVNVLAFVGPVLAFSGVNRAACTTPQIFASLRLAAVLGVITGGLGLLAYLLSGQYLIACALALAAFLLSSERMFTKLLPVRRTRWCVVGGICLVGLGLSWLSPLFLLLLLLIHTACSLNDLRRNWGQKPFWGLVPFDHFRCGSGLREKDLQKYAACRLTRPQNIYVLFLESMHSQKALAELYHSDDFGLTDYLRQRHFEIDPKALSSDTNTVASLFDIIFMNNRTVYELEDVPLPESFGILKNNGYQIALFDTSRYVFNNYIKYADYVNFDMKDYIKRLYARFMPFFMQSRFFRRIIGGPDAYQTRPSFSDLFAGFAAYVQTTTERKCCFFRFGAAHSNWRRTYEQLAKEIPAWDKRYLGLYEKTVREIRQVVDFLQEQDPEACIIVLGDHGAIKFRYSWENDQNPNVSLRACGLEPARVARDMCGVLAACRLPQAGAAIMPVPWSHTHILRQAFLCMGADPSTMSPATPQLSLGTSRYSPLILARNGRLLKEWETITPSAICQTLLNNINLAPEWPDSHLLLANFYLNNGRKELGRTIIHKLRKRFPQHMGIAAAHLRELVHGGRIAEARQLVESPSSPLSHAAMTAELLENIILMHLMAGEIRRAAKCCGSWKARLLLDTETRKNFEVMACLMQGRKEDACALIRRINFADSAFTANFKTFCAYLCLATQEFSLAEQILKTFDKDEVALVQQKMLRGAFYNGTLDWERREAAVREAIALPGMTPVTLMLWLVGNLEQQGRIREAEKEVIKLLDLAQNDNVLEQCGKFFLRNGMERLPREKRILLKKYAYSSLGKELSLLRDHSDVFDAAFYQKTYGSVVQGMDLQQHFMHHNMLLALNPNALFDASFVFVMSPQYAFLGHFPLDAFLSPDTEASHAASLTFWPAAWAAQHPDCLREQMPPLVHAVRLRGKEAASGTA